MKLKLIILFHYSILTTLTCFSQQVDSTSSRQLILKTNLAHFATGEAYISIEKLFDRHRLEVGAGFIYPFRLWYNFMDKRSGFENIMDDDLGLYYQSYGFTIRSQYKYKLNKHAPLYISPLLMFKHVWRNDTHLFHPNGQEIEVFISDKKYVYAIEFLIGAERLFDKRLFLDFYFGIGARYFTTRLLNSPNGIDFTDDAVYRDSGFLPSLHIGMNIGIKVD